MGKAKNVDKSKRVFYRRLEIDKNTKKIIKIVNHLQKKLGN